MERRTRRIDENNASHLDKRGQAGGPAEQRPVTPCSRERLTRRSETRDAVFTVSPESRTRGDRLKSRQEVYIIVKKNKNNNNRPAVSGPRQGNGRTHMFAPCSSSDTETLARPSGVGSKFRGVAISANPAGDPAPPRKTSDEDGSLRVRPSGPGRGVCPRLASVPAKAASAPLSGAWCHPVLREPKL